MPTAIFENHASNTHGSLYELPDKLSLAKAKNADPWAHRAPAKALLAVS
jgi:hypothetical protein